MIQPDRFEDFMALALHEAQSAFEEGEVPVGAVVVSDAGKIIGRGHNRTESLHDATAHAEMIALSAAADSIGDWRLENCFMFCTLEPCAMCAGAAVLARIDTIVFGARDPKFGACGSIFTIPSEPKLNHEVKIVEGVLEAESAELMRDFFARLRRGKEGLN